MDAALALLQRHGRTMSRQAQIQTTSRAARCLAVLAVLAAAALFGFALLGIEPMPVDTTPLGDDSPAVATASLTLPAVDEQLYGEVQLSQPDNAAAETVPLNVPLNEVLGLAENASVFPAAEPTGDLVQSTASQLPSLDAQADAPPLPSPKAIGQFYTRQTADAGQPSLMVPGDQQALGEVADAFGSVPTRSQQLTGDAPPVPGVRTPQFAAPQPAAPDVASLALAPPPLVHQMPEYAAESPAAPGYDPYQVAPLPEDGASAEAAPAATPGPALPPPQMAPATVPARINAGELQSIMQLADQHTRHGFSLGNRAALFSARSEFLNALRLVAQALDAAGQATSHSQALAAGLRALEESDDFIPRDGQVERDGQVAGIVAAHETPVLKGTAAGVPALVALQRYYNYAQEQLALAVQGQPSGSLALHGMAKLYATIAARQPGSLKAPEPKAIVLEHAALKADPRNFMAANDLAVLLVRYGRTSEARALLQQSVSAFGQPENWNNLADLHEQLGEQDLAKLARKAAQDASRKLPTTPGAGALSSAGAPQVDWVKPEAFRGAPDAVAAPNKPAARPMPQNARQPGYRRPAANEMFGTRSAEREPRKPGSR